MPQGNDKRLVAKGNPSLVSFGRKLRKEMTKEERRLWYNFLSKYPVRFYRQKILGQYIVDFYCAGAKLVIELDGSQHYDEVTEQKDLERTAYLQQFGLLVLRFSNLEVNRNFRGICEQIDIIVKQRVQDPSAPAGHLP